MCGIIGIWSKERPISAERLDRAVASLHHRGPDGRRTWIDGDRHVGLGHARLSIIDLTTGDQPLTNEDESLHVVVNGEFYEFERIRGELEARGHRFRTRSDSEILLHLYEEYGTGCVHHLRGEFAFVLWDEKNRLLFAARDRFGIKPLYYAVTGDTVLFASEAKALFAAGVPARWDAESVHQSNFFPVPLQDRTFFAGVYQVPPGHHVVATEGHLRLLRYWDFDYPTADVTAASRHSDEHYVEQFRAAFDEAVRVRLRADVPVAVYLSGGLDSCAVLGVAQAHRSDPIHTFTLGFEHQDYDETAFAAEMAARAGARFTPIAVRGADIVDNFADTIWHGEAMLFNTNSVAKLMLSRAVRDAGYKVVLTGEGSDEILAGYAPFRLDLLLQNAAGQDQAAIAAQIEQLEASNPIGRGILLSAADSAPIESVKRALGFVPAFLSALGSGTAALRGLLHDDFAARFSGRDPYRLFLGGLDVKGQLSGRDPVNQSLYLWSKSALPNCILSLLGDRMEMAHSIEGRVPFLDHRLVELVRAMPVSLKIRGMTEKYVLREAARPVVTETIYRRQKHPFSAPPVTTTQGPLHGMLQDILRGPALRAQPFYNPTKVLALLDKMPHMDAAMRTRIDPLFVLMLSVCVMQERFGLG